MARQARCTSGLVIVHRYAQLGGVAVAQFNPLHRFDAHAGVGIGEQRIEPFRRHIIQVSGYWLGSAIRSVSLFHIRISPCH